MTILDTFLVILCYLVINTTKQFWIELHWMYRILANVFVVITYQSTRHWGHVTRDTLYKRLISSKFKCCKKRFVLWLQIRIFHASRQFICRGMCKIETCSCHYFSCKAKTNVLKDSGYAFTSRLWNAYQVKLLLLHTTMDKSDDSECDFFTNCAPLHIRL